MANTQYLLWVMVSTLTLLCVFISALIGRAKSPRQGVITFVVLFLIVMAAIFLLSR